VGNEVLLDAVLTISTTDTTLLHTCMEALHGLEVFAVDIRLAYVELTCHTGSCVDILGDDSGWQIVLGVV